MKRQPKLVVVELITDEFYPVFSPERPTKKYAHRMVKVNRKKVADFHKVMRKFWSLQGYFRKIAEKNNIY